MQSVIGHSEIFRPDTRRRIACQLIKMGCHFARRASLAPEMAKFPGVSGDLQLLVHYASASRVHVSGPGS